MTYFKQVLDKGTISTKSIVLSKLYVKHDSLIIISSQQMFSYDVK
jgi:hypothetical protein